MHTIEMLVRTDKFYNSYTSFIQIYTQLMKII
jgi:hypothetical protein